MGFGTAIHCFFLQIIVFLVCHSFSLILLCTPNSSIGLSGSTQILYDNTKNNIKHNKDSIGWHGNQQSTINNQQSTMKLKKTPIKQMKTGGIVVVG